MKSFVLLLVALMVSAVVVAAPRREAVTTVKVEVEGRGDFTIRFNGDKAPKTVEQITRLVKAGFYDGQRFHKVEKTPKPFLVQVGDPASKDGDLSGKGGSGKEIGFEDSGLSNVAGAVGLAHPVDQPSKGDSQFYVLLDNATFLDGKYTVFGQVTNGMDVVKRIQKGDRIIRISIVP